MRQLGRGLASCRLSEIACSKYRIIRRKGSNPVAVEGYSNIHLMRKGLLMGAA